MTSLILAGAGIAGAALVLRLAMGSMKHVTKHVSKLPTSSAIFNNYYKGGFEAKMSRREAALILGVSSSSSKARVRDAHKRIMLSNHPDRGGSPYLAAKINQAKDYLDSGGKSGQQ